MAKIKKTAQKLIFENKRNLAWQLKPKKVIEMLAPIEFVDLGLPSGTQWMKCNIGATTEEEYGKHFQWGDTVGYDDNAWISATWSTAPFNNGSSTENLNYFTANSGTWLTSDAVLKLEYDAAYVATNGQAKMPTQADLYELYDNTTSEWTTLNGVNGRKLTSTKEGYTDKYIFIPAAGYGCPLIEKPPFGGSIWSSSWDSVGQGGVALCFSRTLYTVSDDALCSPLSVRGVKI